MKEQIASAESRERTATLLSDLWSRNQPMIEERLKTLERARSEPLTEEARLEAIGVAHKLAGSLGMFGFHEGTEIARELEQLLEKPSPRGTDITRLILQLRGVLSAKQ